MGARMQTYLLEKVRICSQQPGERNFHVLHEACAAAASLPSDSKVFRLPDFHCRRDGAVIQVNLDGLEAASSFSYTKCSGERVSPCSIGHSINTFAERIQAMQAIGISESDVNAVFRTSAAVLHIGNAEFAPNILLDCEHSAVTPQSACSFEHACNHLGVDHEKLEARLMD